MKQHEQRRGLPEFLEESSSEQAKPGLRWRKEHGVERWKLDDEWNSLDQAQSPFVVEFVMEILDSQKEC
jgi:hypothetical protein